MRSESMLFVLLASCALLAPAPVQALDNAGFDTNLLSWDNLFMRPADWDPMDALGNPNSGSARIGNPLPGNGGIGFVLGQCLPVIANQRYRFGAWAQLVTEPPPNVTAEVIVQVYATSDCSDVPFVAYDGPFTVGTAWQRIEGVMPPTALAGSIRVWLGIGKPTGVNEPILARFDDVFVIPLPLFVNGFESQ